MAKGMTDRAAIASRLRLAREQAGLSQGQVGKLLDLHRPTISEIEAGRRRVSAEEVAELSRVYDVSVSWLTGGRSDDEGDRIELAARELVKLKKEDIDKVLKLLQSLRRSKRSSE